MRIMMVSPAAYPFSGGVEKHIHELSKALITLGHEVLVVSHKLGIDSSEENVIEGVNYKYFRAPLNNFYFVSEELVQYVKENASAFDVLHMQALHKPLSIYLVMRLKGLNNKIVLTPHYHGGGHTAFASLAHVFYRFLVRLFITRFDAVLAVSDSEEEILKRDFTSLVGKTHVIPNGIVSPEIIKSKKKDKPVLLTVSRLEPYKRIDKVIQEINDEIDFIIVGNGNDLDRLKNIAASNNKNVTFTGGISDEELNEWWGTADAFVSLSEKEAYGLTFGEAMSIGLPCIVSDIPAYRFVYKLFGEPHGVVFYDPKQNFMRQYSMAIADSLNKSTVMVYTWDKAAAALSKIYKDKKR